MPLRPHPGNDAKSDLKFLECAANGVVALASPTVYQDVIRHGETGFLCHSPKEFASTLRTLLADVELRTRVAENAYRWVKDERLLCLHYHKRIEWYRQMLSRLPELTEELFSRAKECVG